MQVWRVRLRGALLFFQMLKLIGFCPLKAKKTRARGQYSACTALLGSLPSTRSPSQRIGDTVCLLHTLHGRAYRLRTRPCIDQRSILSSCTHYMACDARVIKHYRGSHKSHEKREPTDLDPSHRILSRLVFNRSSIPSTAISR